MESMGVVVRRYIDYLILLIPTPLVSALFYSSIPPFCSFLKKFFILVPVLFCNNFMYENNFSTQYKHTYGTTSVPRQPYEGLHMFYTRRNRHKRTLHILRWTSTVCLQGARCIIINTDLQHMRVYNIHMHVSIGVCDIKMCDVLRV